MKKRIDLGAAIAELIVGSKRRYRISGICIVLAALLACTSPSLAATAGFWACSDGSWIAVGQPDYPAPYKVCGSQLPIPDTEEECRHVGGRWGPVGIFPQPICKVPTHDGGRKCGDNDECEGMCLADLTPTERDQVTREMMTLSKLGYCTPYRPVFGCMAIVKKGQVTGLTCRD